MRADNDRRGISLASKLDERVRHVHSVGHGVRLCLQVQRACQLGALISDLQGVLALGALDSLDRLWLYGKGLSECVIHGRGHEAGLPYRRHHSRAGGEELSGVANGGPGKLRAVVSDHDGRPLAGHKSTLQVAFQFALAWGVAVAGVGTLQLIVALTLERRYDSTILRTFLVAAPYPLAYWLIAAAATLRAETIALLRGPRRQRVVWDIPRERLEA